MIGDSGEIKGVALWMTSALSSRALPLGSSVEKPIDVFRRRKVAFSDEGENLDAFWPNIEEEPIALDKAKVSASAFRGVTQCLFFRFL